MTPRLLTSRLLTSRLLSAVLTLLPALAFAQAAPRTPLLIRAVQRCETASILRSSLMPARPAR